MLVNHSDGRGWDVLHGREGCIHDKETYTVKHNLLVSCITKIDPGNSSGQREEWMTLLTLTRRTTYHGHFHAQTPDA